MFHQKRQVKKLGQFYPCSAVRSFQMSVLLKLLRQVAVVISILAVISIALIVIKPKLKSVFKKTSFKVFFHRKKRDFLILSIDKKQFIYY